MIPYSHWRETPPSRDEYNGLWTTWANVDECHILCGTIEAFDIDAKNDPSGAIVQDFEADIEAYDPDLFSKLYIEQTPSGGRHYIYKAPSIRASRNIAFIEDKNAVLTFDEELNDKKKYLPIIEVKAHGGLCRCWPTAGFTVIQGNIHSLPTLSAQEVSLLEYIASEFNQKPAEKIVESRRERIISDTPGNDYSNNVSISEIADLFTSAGWQFKQQRNRILLRRPGARTKGYDADIHTIKRTFMAYSSSVSDFEPGKGYNFFSVYAILAHRSDFKAAATVLRERGYGASVEVEYKAQPKEKIMPPLRKPEQQEPEETLWEQIQKSRVLMSKPPKNPDKPLTYVDEHGTQYPLVGPGGIFLITGEQKARKTSFTTAIVSAILTGQDRIGFRMLRMMESDQNIVWVDTEQAEDEAYMTARRILIQSRRKEFPDNVHFFSLPYDLTAKERFEHLVEIFANIPNIFVVVIDGIVDFIHDFNDNKESQATGNKIRGICKNAILIPLMHVNRSEGKANGHFGAWWTKKCSAHAKVMLTDDGASEVSFPDIRGAEKPGAFRFEVFGPNIPYLPSKRRPDFSFDVGLLDKAPDTAKEWSGPTKPDISYLAPGEELSPQPSPQFSMPRVEPPDDHFTNYASDEDEIPF